MFQNPYFNYGEARLHRCAYKTTILVIHAFAITKQRFIDFHESQLTALQIANYSPSFSKERFEYNLTEAAVMYPCDSPYGRVLGLSCVCKGRGP